MIIKSFGVWISILKKNLLALSLITTYLHADINESNFIDDVVVDNKYVKYIPAITHDPSSYRSYEYSAYVLDLGEKTSVPISWIIDFETFHPLYPLDYKTRHHSIYADSKNIYGYTRSDITKDAIFFVIAHTSQYKKLGYRYTQVKDKIYYKEKLVCKVTKGDKILAQERSEQLIGKEEGFEKHPYLYINDLVYRYDTLIVKDGRLMPRFYTYELHAYIDLLENIKPEE